MSARELPRQDYARLKLATADLVQACGGGRRAERFTRVSHQHIGNYADEGNDASFMPVDVVADLEAEAASRGQRPFVAEALAELTGHRLVRVAAAGAPNRDEAALIACAKETTEAIADAWAAIADGRKTREECRHAIREFDEAIAALLEARELFVEGLK